MIIAATAQAPLYVPCWIEDFVSTCNACSFADRRVIIILIPSSRNQQIHLILLLFRHHIQHMRVLCHHLSKSWPIGGLWILMNRRNTHPQVLLLTLRLWHQHCRWIHRPLHRFHQHGIQRYLIFPRKNLRLNARGTLPTGLPMKDMAVTISNCGSSLVAPMTDGSKESWAQHGKIAATARCIRRGT
jgi:hypothetical protein